MPENTEEVGHFCFMQPSLDTVMHFLDGSRQIGGYAALHGTHRIIPLQYLSSHLASLFCTRRLNIWRSMCSRSAFGS